MTEPQTQMRQPPPAVRQSPERAVRASWTARPGLRSFLRGLLLALAAGLFLALVGAFGTSAAPLWARLIYWITLCLLGSIVGGGLAPLLRRILDFDGRPWLSAGLMTLGLSVPFTGAVYAITNTFFGGHFRLPQLAAFFPSVLLVTAAITGLNFLAYRRQASLQPAADVAPPETAAPRFLERLPPKLRGADLWAVEAEDHYLRLHTSLGQDLILMRLSDAVTELEGVEGARTHRSWWVARGAVTDVRRGDGRATLTLKGGVQIPVSRAYARILREAGWF